MSSRMSERLPETPPPSPRRARPNARASQPHASTTTAIHGASMAAASKSAPGMRSTVNENARPTTQNRSNTGDTTAGRLKATEAWSESAAPKLTVPTKQKSSDTDDNSAGSLKATDALWKSAAPKLTAPTTQNRSNAGGKTAGRSKATTGPPSDTSSRKDVGPPEETELDPRQALFYSTLDGYKRPEALGSVSASVASTGTNKGKGITSVDPFSDKSCPGATLKTLEQSSGKDLLAKTTMGAFDLTASSQQKQICLASGIRRQTSKSLPKGKIISSAAMLPNHEIPLADTDGKSLRKDVAGSGTNKVGDDKGTGFGSTSSANLRRQAIDYSKCKFTDTALADAIMEGLVQKQAFIMFDGGKVDLRFYHRGPIGGIACLKESRGEDTKRVVTEDNVTSLSAFVYKAFLKRLKKGFYEKVDSEELAEVFCKRFFAKFLWLDVEAYWTLTNYWKSRSKEQKDALQLIIQERNSRAAGASTQLGGSEASVMGKSPALPVRLDKYVDKEQDGKEQADVTTSPRADDKHAATGKGAVATPPKGSDKYVAEEQGDVEAPPKADDKYVVEEQGDVESPSDVEKDVQLASKASKLASATRITVAKQIVARTASFDKETIVERTHRSSTENDTRASSVSRSTDTAKAVDPPATTAHQPTSTPTSKSDRPTKEMDAALLEGRHESTMSVVGLTNHIETLNIGAASMTGSVPNANASTSSNLLNSERNPGLTLETVEKSTRLNIPVEKFDLTESPQKEVGLAGGLRRQTSNSPTHGMISSPAAATSAYDNDDETGPRKDGAKDSRVDSKKATKTVNLTNSSPQKEVGFTSGRRRQTSNSPPQSKFISPAATSAHEKDVDDDDDDDDGFPPSNNDSSGAEGSDDEKSDDEESAGSGNPSSSDRRPPIDYSKCKFMNTALADAIWEGKVQNVSFILFQGEEISLHPFHLSTFEGLACLEERRGRFTKKVMTSANTHSLFNAACHKFTKELAEEVSEVIVTKSIVEETLKLFLKRHFWFDEKAFWDTIGYRELRCEDLKKVLVDAMQVRNLRAAEFARRSAQRAGQQLLLPHAAHNMMPPYPDPYAMMGHGPYHALGHGLPRVYHAGSNNNNNNTIINCHTYNAPPAQQPATYDDLNRALGGLGNRLQAGTDALRDDVERLHDSNIRGFAGTRDIVNGVARGMKNHLDGVNGRVKVVHHDMGEGFHDMRECFNEAHEHSINEHDETRREVAKVRYQATAGFARTNDGLGAIDEKVSGIQATLQQKADKDLYLASLKLKLTQLRKEDLRMILEKGLKVTTKPLKSAKKSDLFSAVVEKLNPRNMPLDEIPEHGTPEDMAKAINEWLTDNPVTPVVEEAAAPAAASA